MADGSESTKCVLPESQIPKHWYTIQADLPKPAPPVPEPGTKKPVGPDDFAPLFAPQCIQQEVS